MGTSTIFDTHRKRSMISNQMRTQGFHRSQVTKASFPGRSSWSSRWDEDGMDLCGTVTSKSCRKSIIYYWMKNCMLIEWYHRPSFFPVLVVFFLKRRFFTGSRYAWSHVDWYVCNVYVNRPQSKIKCPGLPKMGCCKELCCWSSKRRFDIFIYI